MVLKINKKSPANVKGNAQQRCNVVRRSRPYGFWLQFQKAQ